MPSWFAQRDIIYPTKLNIEQASSEVTADYKAQLVSGNHLLDASGGFGVDSLYLSKRVNKVLHCEIDKGLSECAAHNFDILGAKNIETKVGGCLSLLSSMNKSFDWIYLDPSRRDTGNKKVFLLKDYQPNVPENLNILFGKTNNILLKTSPFLDISRGIEELNFVKEIRVVAVKNEVKELLWVLEYGFSEEVKNHNCQFNYST